MRILVVFCNDMFVGHYVNSGALEAIESEHEVLYLASGKTSGLDFNERFAGKYNFPPELSHRHYALFNALMWKYRDRSPSFRFRYRRLLQLGELTHGKLRRFANAYINRGTSPIFARFGTTDPFYLQDMPICHSLETHILKIKPDLIIFPSSAYDPEGNDVARIGKKLDITTLFLIDNWDNLSSKTIFWAFPDHLGVWGPQSKEHAVRIQHFQPDDITCIGTPRFDVYRENPPSPYPFEYALFVGQAIPFNELESLWILEREIALHGGPKVVYRPHPYRQTRLCNDKFDPAQFKHIVLDTERNSQHYPALVKNAQFVVATPTTMLIEALLCKRPVLLLAYDDGIHLTSPANSLLNYEHFKGITELKGVTTCRYSYNLPYLFRHMDSTSVDVNLSYYLFDDGRPYGERLSDLVRRLVCGNSK